MMNILPNHTVHIFFLVIHMLGSLNSLRTKNMINIALNFKIDCVFLLFIRVRHYIDSVEVPEFLLNAYTTVRANVCDADETIYNY